LPTLSLIEENRRLNTEEVRSGKTRLASAPLQVNVELTGVCNIDPPCLFCSGKNFGHNYRPLDPGYLAGYSDVLERCEHVNEDSFGEPLSHPALLELAQRFTANGQVFSFVTNGLLLTREKADKLAACGPKLGIHVSFNAATADTFYKLTGKSFARVVENVRYYVQSYRERNRDAAPDLILTFIVMKINRHEVAGFLRLTRDLGARALLAPLHDRPSVPLGHFGYDFVYEDEMLPYPELQRVGEDALALSRRLGIDCILQWDPARDSAIRGFAEPGVAAPCLVPWRFLFIQEHTRKIFACPYHRHPYGDLQTATLEEIWNGETAQGMRRSLADGEIPKYCLDHSASCPLVMEARNRPPQDIDDHVLVGENDFRHLTVGWHPLEHVPDPIRWTSRAAEFLIRTDGCTGLFVEATVWGKASVRGRIEIDGRDLGDFCVESGRWNRLAFRLPGAPTAAILHGRIVTPQTWVPAQEGLGGDTRQLGIAVRRIWVADALPRRMLGRTGVEIPILGLGTAPSGHRTEKEAVAFYHRCIDAGVTHLDTGPQVGGFGNAQRYLGQVLKERRQEVFVATRCCEPDGERALQQLQRNLAELQIEQADLVYAQSIGDDNMTPERIYAADGVCKALEKARRDGLTRWLGVSGHSRPWRFVKALEEWDFDVMMTAASLVSRHIYDFETQVWPAAAGRGIGLLAMKVFGGVMDSAKGPKGAHLPDALKPAGLRYALGLPGASGVVLGLHDEAELRQALSWVRCDAPLTAEELAPLEEPTRDLAGRWRELYGPRV